MNKRIQFPNRVWEPSTVPGLWTSRPVTKEDKKRRLLVLAALSKPEPEVLSEPEAA